MPLKQYRVEVTVPVIVLAESKDEAAKLATKNPQINRHIDRALPACFIYDDAIEEWPSHDATA